MLIPCIYFDKDIIFCKKMQPRRLKMEAPGLTTQKIGSVTCSGAALKLAVPTLQHCLITAGCFQGGAWTTRRRIMGRKSWTWYTFCQLRHHQVQGAAARTIVLQGMVIGNFLCVDSLR